MVAIEKRGQATDRFDKRRKGYKVQVKMPYGLNQQGKRGASSRE